MRIAALADVHGNLAAFEAAIAHARAQSPDLIVLLGDYSTGPDALACWQLAQSLGCPLLRGNHERYLFSLTDPASPALWRSEQFLPMQWSHAQLPAGALNAMRALPLALQLPGAPGTTFAHATASSDSQLIRPHMSDAEFELALRDTNTPILIRGHEHFARENRWRDRRIVTIAPVGIPLDMDPRTGYAQLDFSAAGVAVAHHRVEYDLQRTLQRFHDTGWLRDAGVMGRLYFLEFKLSIGMLVPFLNWHARWHKQHGFSLEQTFARLFGDGL